MMVLFSHFAKAGNSCSSSVILNTDSIINTTNIDITDTVDWFSFSSDSTSNYISVKPNSNNRLKLNIKIYQGPCTALNELMNYDVNVLDTIFHGLYSQFTANSNYYVKITNLETYSQSFELKIIKNQTPLFLPLMPPCPNDCSIYNYGCDGGNFENNFTPGSNASPGCSGAQSQNNNGWNLNPNSGNGMFVSNQRSNQQEFTLSHKICDEKIYCFSFKYANLLSYTAYNQYPTLVYPKFRVVRNEYDANSVLISTQIYSEITVAPNNNPNNWLTYFNVYQPTIGADEVEYIVYAGNFGGSSSDIFGADIAYDDISLGSNLTKIHPISFNKTFTICNGQSAQLVVEPFQVPCSTVNSFFYSGNILNIAGGGLNVNVSPTVTTTYIFYTYITEPIPPLGCISIDTIQFNVIVNNFEVNAGPDLNVCQNEAFNLGANVVTNNVILPVSHYWSYNGNFYTNNLNPLIPANTLSVGAHTFVLNYFSNGCLKKDTLVVNILPMPTIGFSQSIVSCIGQPFTLNVNTTGGITFNWYYNNNQIAVTQVNSLELSSTVYGIGTHVFTVVVTSANGCTNSTDLSVTIFPVPIVNAGEDLAVCQPGLFDLLGTATSANGILSTEWIYNSSVLSNDLNFLDVTSSNYPLGSNVFSLVATNIEGCSATDNITVDIVDVLPPYALVIQPGSSTCGSTTVCLQPTPLPGVSLLPSASLPPGITETVAGTCATYTFPNPFFGGTIEDMAYTLNGECLRKSTTVLDLLPCCSGLIQVTNYNDLLNPNLFGTFGIDGLVIDGQTFNISGNLFINGDLQNIRFNNCQITMSPNAAISVNNSTFGLNNTQIRACSQMWQGISITGKSKVEIVNSDIRDALVAVLVNGNNAPSNLTPVGFINNNHFHRNRVSIRIQRYLFELIDANNIQTGTNPIALFGNRITGNQSLLNGAANSTIGIEIDRVRRNVVIGGEDEMQGNVIDGGLTGINVLRSNVFVYNNYISNTTTIGLRASYLAVPGAINSYFVVGDNFKYTSGTPGNYFINNVSSINCSGRTISFIANNTIEEGINAVRVSSNRGEPIDIINNSILNNRFAIALQFNNNVSAFVPFFNPKNVTNNAIINDPNLFVFAMSNQVTRGILVSEPTGTLFTGYNIRENRIFEFDENISVTGSFGAKIVSNNLIIRKRPIATLNFGIRIQNHIKGIVSENFVRIDGPIPADPDGADINRTHVGLIVSGSTGASICGNSFGEVGNNIPFIGVGVQFAGINAPVNQFANNTFNQYHRALFLNGANTPMGIIGNTDNPAGNEFHNLQANGWHTFLDQAVPPFPDQNLNRLWVNNQVPFMPNLYSEAPSGALILDQTFSTNSPTCQAVQRPANQSEIDKLDDIALDSAQAQNNTLSKKWRAKEALKYTISKDSTLSNFSVFEEFNDSISTVNIGKISYAKELLSYPLNEESIGELNVKANEINVQIPVEALYREVLILAALNPELKDSVYTEQEIIQLTEIANQCPYTKGGGVILARSILYALDELPLQYFNECEMPNQEIAGRMANSGEEEEEIIIDTKVRKTQEKITETVSIKALDATNVEFKVYPNPAKEILYIKLPALENNSKFNYEICNSQGQVVLSLQNKVALDKIDISNLSDGIYLLKALNTNTYEIFTYSFIVKR
jgi:hypothetical protein